MSRKRESSSKDSGRRRKSFKGLRQFSLLVLQKCEEKQITSYTQVADELVREDDSDFDDKNIRRRVYDALNVLIALDILEKDEKKTIMFKGLPSAASQDLAGLEQEIHYRKSQIARKQNELVELLTQSIGMRNLVRNNAQNPSQHKIPLPCVVLNTSPSAVVQCNMSQDRRDIMFDFSMPFEVNDDNRILQALGYDKTRTTAELRDMVGDDLYGYLSQHRLAMKLVARNDSL